MCPKGLFEFKQFILFCFHQFPHSYNSYDLFKDSSPYQKYDLKDATVAVDNSANYCVALKLADLQMGSMCMAQPSFIIPLYIIWYSVVSYRNMAIN